MYILLSLGQGVPFGKGVADKAYQVDRTWSRVAFLQISLRGTSFCTDNFAREVRMRNISISQLSIGAMALLCGLGVGGGLLAEAQAQISCGQTLRPGGTSARKPTSSCAASSMWNVCARLTMHLPLNCDEKDNRASGSWSRSAPRTSNPSMSVDRSFRFSMTVGVQKWDNTLPSCIRP